MPLKTLFAPELYDGSKPQPSWWEASAPIPQDRYAPFEGETECEVAVIGGGFTGLSTAFHLAKEHGIEARVFEAGHIGWGASGRNGGFCCFSPDKLGIKGIVAAYGLEEAKAYYRSQLDAIALVDRLGREEGIDYDRQGDGFYEVAHAPGLTEGLAEEGKALTEHFAIGTQLLSKEEFGEIGTRGPSSSARCT